MTADAVQPRTGQINWDAVPDLSPIRFGTHCDHHAELKVHPGEGK